MIEGFILDHKYGKFILFAIIGAFGFVVDVIALVFAKEVVHLDLYSGRLFSYLIAASFTWYANRRLTFKNHYTADSVVVQWVKFLHANCYGGLLNYSVYSLGVSFFGEDMKIYILSVACGSVSGLVLNFILSSRLVFKSHK